MGLYNLYGPTEATVDVSYYDCSPQFFSTDVPIGGPIENIRLYILDEHYRLAPIGMPGTLYIAGDGLARGYLNRPELTAKQFMTVCSERVYNTNDRARQTLDGHIHFLGRKDFQVKLNGFRIELDEIQHVLNRSAFVEQSVVIKYEDASPRFRSIGCLLCTQKRKRSAGINRFPGGQQPRFRMAAGLQQNL